MVLGGGLDGVALTNDGLASEEEVQMTVRRRLPACQAGQRFFVHICHL